MTKLLRISMVVLGLGLGVILMTAQPGIGAAGMGPSDGWTLHIDALMHFPGKSSMVAHHWCKGNLAGGLTECQLYDSDAPNGRLVGVEVVVPTSVVKTYAASEQALWHYHKTEIPKVKATLPGLSAEEAAKVAKSLEETYGKIYLLWDPARKSVPTGRPTLTILK